MYYVYEEAKLTKTEFEDFYKQKFIESADIINTISESQTESGDNQISIMEALADLYDVVASTV